MFVYRERSDLKCAKLSLHPMHHILLALLMLLKVERIVLLRSMLFLLNKFFCGVKIQVKATPMKSIGKYGSRRCKLSFSIFSCWKTDTDCEKKRLFNLKHFFSVVMCQFDEKHCWKAKSTLAFTLTFVGCRS